MCGPVKRGGGVWKGEEGLGGGGGWKGGRGVGRVGRRGVRRVWEGGESLEKRWM